MALLQNENPSGGSKEILAQFTANVYCYDICKKLLLGEYAGACWLLQHSMPIAGRLTAANAAAIAFDYEKDRVQLNRLEHHSVLYAPLLANQKPAVVVQDAGEALEYYKYCRCLLDVHVLDSSKGGSSNVLYLVDGRVPREVREKFNEHGGQPPLIEMARYCYYYEQNHPEPEVMFSRDGSARISHPWVPLFGSWGESLFRTNGPLTDSIEAWERTANSALRNE
ncbi:MAG: hypothetical protein V1728_05770 [Candidatus Micrarchaeota archaeon]